MTRVASVFFGFGVYSRLKGFGKVSYVLVFSSTYPNNSPCELKLIIAHVISVALFFHFLFYFFFWRLLTFEVLWLGMIGLVFFSTLS